MAETVAQTISWPVLKKHLDSLMERAADSMDDAETDELKRLQGEKRLLKKLLNLPETLAMLDAEDRRIADEKR